MKKIIYCITLLLGTYCLSTAQPAGGSRMVQVSTSFGDIKIRLYDQTPLHRDNFIKLVEKGFYDSLLFHRVIYEFMIQGGDPDSKNAPSGKLLGEGDIGYRIPAEFVDTIFHKKGVLAAARDNNPEKASSGCQFYIVQGKVRSNEELDNYERAMGRKFSPQQRKIYTTVGGTPHLDGSYTVFGEVTEGQDVVDKIAAVKVDLNSRPLEDVRMTIRLVSK
jgi:cyclophilin family peptidyl-prolyl cis-trans isomerase